MPVVVRSAVEGRHRLRDVERYRRINVIGTMVQEAGVEARGSAVQGRAEVVLASGSTTFDGETFSIAGRVSSAHARLIVELARALDWPALVVEGDSRSADEIIVAGVPLGMTAINVCASDKAIRVIQKNYGHLLADTIRPLDPCDVVDHALKAKPEKVDQTDFDMAESKSASADEENGRQIGAPPSDGGIVDHALKAKPEKTDLTDFDLDMPEPKSDRAEEEKQRQSSVMLWENWVTTQQDDRLRELREHCTPPKGPGKGPP